MAQGKIKNKTKVPQNIKIKKTPTKRPAITKRANRPVQPKKKRFEEAHKLKKMISKTVNKAVEDEIRSVAYPGKRTLSVAQKAVANHHKSNNI